MSTLSGGWASHQPSWKMMEFVTWDEDSNPILMGKCQIDGNQTTNQLYIYIYTSWCFKQHGEKSLPSKCRRDGATTPRQRPRAAHGGFHGFLGPFKRLKEAQNGWCISWKISVKWINIDGLFHGKSYENGWWLGVFLGNHHIYVLMLICREKMGTSHDSSDNWIVIIECYLCFFFTRYRNEFT